MEFLVKLRLLATSDTHFNFDADDLNDKFGVFGDESSYPLSESLWFPDNIDVFVHAGDLMYHGTESEWNTRVRSLASVQAKLKLYVPGNHDLFVQHYTGPANQDLRSIADVRMLGTHPKFYTYTLKNKMKVLGLPFVTELPGWAFNETEERLYWMVEQLVAEHKKDGIDMVISHSPPYGILDGSHWGVKAWNILQYALKPEIWICGHIHENYGMHLKDGTTYYNVSMLDRDYKFKNRPVLLEL
jgi:Icc-related predicted phosphoesterase